MAKTAAVYRTGFCGIGLHEGTSPVGVSGTPLKVCVFWIDCGCECHKELTEIFELTGVERTPQQNPKWSVPKSTFVMPSVVPTVEHSQSRMPLEGLELADPTDVPEGLKRPPTVPLPPAEGRSFGPTATGRAARGELEMWVREVTNAFVVEEQFDPNWKELCTPPYIAKEISRTQGVVAPSTGAITSVLDRWTNIGYAVTAKKPIRFVGYTEKGIKLGLEKMKADAKRKPSASAGLERVTTKRGK
jgi:hypothetical protein